MLRGAWQADRGTCAGIDGAATTRVQAALEALKPVTDHYSITRGQLVLAWISAQPGACAIAGATNKAGARAIIDKARRGMPRRRPAPPLGACYG